MTMARQAVAALGWIPTGPHVAWCPTSNLLALEASVSPGDAAVFVLDPSCPKARRAAETALLLPASLAPGCKPSLMKGAQAPPAAL